MQLAKVIYDIEDNKDSLVFYSLSILILMISIFQTKNMSEFLHPKKLISLILETATTSEVMETTQYESVIPVFTELLTTIRQKVTMSRVANILAVYNWAGNIVCISDVILPPGRDRVIHHVENVKRYLIHRRLQTFVIVSEHMVHACFQSHQQPP